MICPANGIEADNDYCSSFQGGGGCLYFKDKCCYPKKVNEYEELTD